MTGVYAIDDDRTWLVTAVRNGSGNLEAIVWEDTGSALVRKSSATAGALSAVAVAGRAWERCN